MKVEKQAKKAKANKLRGGGGVAATKTNSTKKYGLLALLAVVTGAGIFGVTSIGHKAEQTVDVVMLKDGAYKNQLITESMLVKYPMLQAEYEKYSIINSNGVATRRFLTWNEAKQAVGYYAAYPILLATSCLFSNGVSAKIGYAA